MSDVHREGCSIASGARGYNSGQVLVAPSVENKK